MKNLGKHDLIIQTFTDDVLTHEHQRKSVIYQKKDGSFWVNGFPGTSKYPATFDNIKNLFYRKANFYSIKKFSI